MPPAPARVKLLALALAAGATLAAVEAAGQLAIRVKHGLWPLSFARLHFRGAASLYMADHPYLPYLATKGETGLLRFNSKGDRGPELESPKRRRRVLCYGGSTTFDGTHAEAETWPGVLQRLLGPGWEVVNAAQNGATTADTLVNFSLIHQDDGADFVLALEGINDLEPSFFPGFRPDYAHRRRKIGGVPYPVLERLPRWLDGSAIAAALRWKLIGPRGDLHAQFSRPGAYDFVNGPFGVPVFRRNLESLAALARRRGAKTILGVPPYREEWARERFGPEFAAGWRKGLAAETAALRALVRADPAIGLADAAAAVPADPAHMTDFCHLTPAGNESVARAFLAELRRLDRR